MQILLYISDFIVPFIVLGIVTYGLLVGVNVYETFIKGAKSGFLTVIRLMPTLIGLMAAVGILRASGFLDFLSSVVSVQHMEMEAISPRRESVPNSLNTSRSSPVAAEEENIFTTVRGTSSPGNPM